MTQGYGTLHVSVQSGNGAFPVRDAVVIVYYEKKVVGMFRSDRDGNTTDIEIKAPSAALSEVPQSRYIPYGVCDVKVSKEGYYINYYKNVQIFDEQVSSLTANLVPLPEYTAGINTEKVYDISAHNLAVTGGIDGR